MSCLRIDIPCPTLILDAPLKSKALYKKTVNCTLHGVSCIKIPVSKVANVDEKEYPLYVRGNFVYPPKPTVRVFSAY